MIEQIHYNIVFQLVKEGASYVSIGLTSEQLVQKLITLGKEDSILIESLIKTPRHQKIDKIPRVSKLELELLELDAT